MRWSWALTKQHLHGQCRSPHLKPDLQDSRRQEWGPLLKVAIDSKPANVVVKELKSYWMPLYVPLIEHDLSNEKICLRSAQCGLSASIWSSVSIMQVLSYRGCKAFVTSLVVVGRWADTFDIKKPSKGLMIYCAAYPTPMGSGRDIHCKGAIPSQAVWLLERYFECNICNSWIGISCSQHKQGWMGSYESQSMSIDVISEIDRSSALTSYSGMIATYIFEVIDCQCEPHGKHEEA